MAQSTLPRGNQNRRVIVGVVGALGVAIVGLALLLGWRAGTLPPNGVAAATGSPGPSLPGIASAQPPTAAPPTEAPPTPTPTEALVPAPLTGLLVTPAAAAQHPIAVMIDDHIDARPQSGFNAASIVWQAPAEGGIPRYMMIFQDAMPAAVGPVRSSREYFLEWAAEWNAMYVHVGGSPQALATLQAKGSGQWVYNADEFRYGGKYLWRITERFAPHNVYSDGAHLRALETKVGATDGPIDPVWSFGPDVTQTLRPEGGTIVVNYPYETITYRYDRITNRYVRYINTSKTPQVDAIDNSVVAPRNVVILRMFFGALANSNPAKHRLEARNVGHGEAWIATDGHTIKGTWSKASPTAPTLLFGPDGKPVTLTAGQTFVQVLPLTYTFKISDGSLPVVVPNQVPAP